MDKALNNHKRKMAKEINELRSNNSKEYWKLLNNHKNKVQPDIPIDKLFDFFKNLNAAPEGKRDNNLPTLNPNDVNRLNDNLNRRFSRDEIYRCIKKLKNDKAYGDDLIINEYIKSTVDKFIELYEKLFNLIFETGIIPDSWLIGYIKPIYKNNGNTMDPKNFRPITILSCLGKLFISVLSERLTDYSDNFLILSEKKCGFRKKYSTIDNLFLLHSLFEIMKIKKKKNYSVRSSILKKLSTRCGEMDSGINCY